MFHKSYRQILREAWQITFRYPFLWVLALFASFAVNTGIYEGSINNIITVLRSQTLRHDVLELYTGGMRDTFISFGAQIQVPTADTFVGVIIILALAVFLVFLTTVSQIGLIRSVAKAQKGKKISLSIAYANSTTHFAPVLVINILSRLAYVLIFLLASIPLFAALVTRNEVTITLATLIFFLIFIPLSLALAFVTIYAINYSILHGKSLGSSIADGWRLMRNNMLTSLEIGVTLLLIKLAAVLVTIIVAGLIFIPLALLVTMFLVLGQPVLFGILLVLGAVIGIMIFTLVTAWYTSYYLTTWTILFIDISENTLLSKMMRWVKGLQVKKLADGAQVAASDVAEIVENKIEEAKPIVDKLMAEASKKYEKEKPRINEIRAEAEKIVREEAREIVPTLQKLQQQLKSDSKIIAKEVAPKVKKEAVAINKKLQKEYPQLKGLQKEVKQIFTKDLEEALKKVMPAEKKKKPAVKKKATPKKETTTKKSTITAAAKAKAAKAKKKTTTKKK